MTRSPPPVSVVMPAFNREALVGRAIRSILDQDFPDFELIVVDDGSTDRTAEVVRGFDDPRLRLAVLPANCGAAAARNAGHRLARGEFIAVMDSDNLAYPFRLGRQVEFLRANPEVDILAANAIRVEAAGRTEVRHEPGDAMIKARLLNCDGSAMFHGGVMFRVRFLSRTGLSYLPEKTDEDHALWIEAVSRGARFDLLGDHLYEYHRHDANATSHANPEYAGHYARKTPLRARLLGIYFPQLSHAEAAAIAIWMEEDRQQSLVDAALALAAIGKAVTDSRSHRGESKAELGEILRFHAARAIKAMARGAQAQDSGTTQGMTRRLRVTPGGGDAIPRPV